jgi:hypothetical protein
MPKIEVGEFCKPYNIALGFKFKTQSIQLYILNFEQKWYLKSFCPY